MRARRVKLFRPLINRRRTILICLLQTDSSFFGEALELECPFPERLRRNADFWQSLDPWAAGIVREGLSLDFQKEPRPSGAPREPRKGLEVLRREVEEMVRLGAVGEVPLGSSIILQKMFVLPKPHQPGEWRPVLDARPVNALLPPPDHFKLEGWAQVRALLRRNFFLSKLDLSKAYWHVPIHPKDQKFLAFRLEGREFQFRSLPFGLSTAPLIFTKIMRVPIGYLRVNGVLCVIYLDDLLLLASSEEECRESVRLALDVLTRCGFTVNLQKSELEPKRRLRFLGLEIDTSRMEVTVPKEKVEAALRAVDALLAAKERPSAKHVAGLLGLLGSFREAIDPVFLFSRHMAIDKDVAVKRGGWRAPVALSPGSKMELRWWRDNLVKVNGSSLTERLPEFILNTDSSLTGWGAVLTLPGGQTSEAGGFLPPRTANFHINTLELFALLQALKAFAPTVKGRCLKWLTDSMVGSHVVRRWKARSLQALPIVRELWQLTTELGVTLLVQHIPGVTNVRADQISRAREPEDWKLNERLFGRVCKRLGFAPTVDAFATALNTQLPRFWSFRPEPGAMAVDALAQDWTQEKVYGNPPFSLLGRVLRLLVRQQATALLVVPVWKGQPWWPMLCSMLVRPPVLLPNRKDTFIPGLGGSVIPMGKTTWRAWACLVSGHYRWRKPPMAVTRALSLSPASRTQKRSVVSGRTFARRSSLKG